MKVSLTEFFAKYEWIYSPGRLPNMFTLSLAGNNGTYFCIAESDEEQRRLLFISFMGLNCPPERMRDMVELLNRLNSSLNYGNFEMNIPNGEVKFRTGTYFEDTDLTEKAINNVIFRNINTIDISNKLLSKFMLGEVSSENVYDELFPKALLETDVEIKKQDL